jgi:hypothetical protein
MRKNQKKAKTKPFKDHGGESLVPKSKAAAAPEYPFYALNEATYHLDNFARYAVALKDFKRLSRFYSGSESSEFDLSSAWISNDGRFDWLSESYLMRALAVILGKGDVQGFQRLANAQRAYEEGFGEKMSNKDMAKIHLMIACNSMWKNGRNRSEVTMGEIKDFARQLWAESACRRKRQDPTPLNITHEQKNLPHVNWTLILEEIGLDDIKPAKRGRKKIGNKIHS